MKSLLGSIVITGALIGIGPARAALPGQIVRLNTTAESLPLPDVSDAIDAAVVAWGENYGAALRADGTVVAWGSTFSGPLTTPAGLRDVAKLDAGNGQILALKRDGTVVSFPAITSNGVSYEPPAGLNDAVDVGAGFGRSFAVRRNGTVVGWGEAGNVPPNLANVQAISIGEGGYNLALKKDGTVEGWMAPGWSSVATIPAGLTGIVQVAAGYDHGLALRNDGTVSGWGVGTKPPAGLSDVVEIAAGQSFSLARKRDGSVVGWGEAFFGGPALILPPGLVGVSKLAAGRSGAVAITGPRALNQSASIALAAGYDLTLGAPTTAPANATFQWRKDGKAISGATGSTLLLPFLQPAASGGYDVLVNSAASPAVTLSVTGGDGRNNYLANLSARGIAGPGEKTMIVGLVSTGNSARQTLLRGIGPTLTTFGVAGALSDPVLRLFQDGIVIGENDNWAEKSIAPDLMLYYFQQVGAFALDRTSRDGALQVNLNPGRYSAHVLANGAPGVALMECYDSTFALEWPNTAYGGKISGRLLNLSTRGEAGVGENALIAGFVLTGDGPQRVLLRGVGPALKQFGLATALGASRLTLFQGGSARLIAQDAGWSTSADAAAIRSVSPLVGAFGLDEGNKDAVLLLYLQPGSYTAQLTPAEGSPGVGLVEVYEVDN